MSPIVGVMGMVALTGGLLWIFFALMARAHAAHVARLEAEGVLKRTERTAIRSILRNYESASRYSLYRYSRRRGLMALTEKALEIVTLPMSFRFVDADLAHVRLKAEGNDALLLVTTQPPEARGSVELTVWVPDAAAIRSRLRFAGIGSGDTAPRRR